MTAASPVAAARIGSPSPWAPLGAAASRPLSVAFVITALVTALRLVDTVDSDVAWQLWIAQRIHAGANLYTDIIEVNPPLWFWMALPVDRLATLLHFRPETVLIVAMGGLVALALAATNRLLPHLSAGRRTLLLGYGALILAAMPWMHVGQREQIVMIGTIPYTALVAARREAKPVPAMLAALIGCSAALGFALKHYFLVVPAVLELWLVAGRRRAWRPVRPETLAIAAVGAAYAAAVVLLEGDFLSNVVPLVRLAYGVTGAPGFAYLFGPFAVVGLATLAFVAAHARLLAKRGAPFASALLVAAIASTIIYFLQSKGWLYHAIPLLGCASLALAALLVECPAMPASLRVASPALLLLPFALAAQDERNPVLPSPDLNNAISGAKAGDTVGFIALEPAVPWSVTLQHEFRYPSRYIGYWMLHAVVGTELAGRRDPRLAKLGRTVVSQTVDDFRCVPPKWIIIARPRAGEPGFDILPFFLRDPEFARLLSHYRVRSRTSLETYELSSPLSRPTTACRHGV
jgi:hypothetical protein